MSKDEPLTDSDRRPWLERVWDLAAREAAAGRNAVLSCSCLKRAYRDLVRQAGPEVRFLHLAIDPETAAVRVAGRGAHFFDASLVGSQFRDLEPPRRALTLDASQPVAEIVRQAVEALGLAEPGA